MKVKSHFLFVAVLFVLFAQQASAEYRLIVRVGDGLAGIQRICTLRACTVTQGLDGTLGQLFLVTIPDSADPNMFLASLQIENGVSNAELDVPLAIAPVPISDAIPGGLSDSRPFSYFGTTVWNGYANQPASQVIGVN